MAIPRTPHNQMLLPAPTLPAAAEASVSTPSTASMATALSVEKRKFGRRLYGRFQTVFMADCIALATLNPDHGVSAIPIPSARPLPGSARTFLEIWVPITGKLASAESTMLC